MTTLINTVVGEQKVFTENLKKLMRTVVIKNSSGKLEIMLSLIQYTAGLETSAVQSSGTSRFSRWASYFSISLA